ncbi:MAG: hypothetical protein WD294_02330 [Phycisphaeraceae bacterium]
MTTFTDNAGRTWTLSITVDAIKRVQSLLGVNLANVTAPPQEGGEGEPLLTRLETDLVLLCDVIYAIVKPQADQQGISDEQFGQALGGDAILAAHDAFWSALADFFRSLRRSDQVRAIEKQTALVHAAVEAADKRIDALDVAGIVDRAMNVPLGGGGGGSASS